MDAVATAAADAVPTIVTAVGVVIAAGAAAALGIKSGKVLFQNAVQWLKAIKG